MAYRPVQTKLSKWPHVEACLNGCRSGQGLPMIGKLLGHTQVQTTFRL